MTDPTEKNWAFDQQDHLQVVDALRGYAILLVIAVHSLNVVKELVWPAKRLLSLGFYGVQLFFLASALTLLMSWHRSDDGFARRSGKFLLRRFFRIAPLYYLAVLFYWFAYQRTPAEFSFELLISTLLFYNAWSPYLTPTVPGWTPVPGGWSISVEFCFYFAFPFLAVLITTLRRAVVFFMAALALLIVSSIAGAHLYPEISAEARSNFLYFWPPNQLIIFSLGFLLYHSVTNESIKAWLASSRVTANNASFVLCTLLVALSYYGPRKFFEWPLGLPPTHLLISILFLAWAIVIVIKPRGFAVNSAVAGLGKVSFSAYVLHFAVLKFVGMFFDRFWPFAKVGAASIPYAIALLALAIVVTRFVSAATYRFIEQPFINAGKTLIRRVFRSPRGDARQLAPILPS